MVIVLVLFSLISVVVGLNIALHAQLHPSADKVVGSVITTNGLRSAFLKRHDVEHVEIFYPFRYEGFLDHQWDVLFIEGWFPSIDNVLALVRANLPDCTIVFICLDPTYPGLEIVSKFAVDAIVTNSKDLLAYFEPIFPTEYMLLAADVELMRPHPEIARNWGAIYVGAGGHMLNIKPELRSLLLSAVPYRLRLHGSNWENIREFKDIAMGMLPELELSPSYSSAEVVLAATIQSQSNHHMVNNRIFEALSCGAIVVAQYRQELYNLGCEAILLLDENHSFNYYMDRIKSNASYAARLRQVAREFILQNHSWDHRTVQLVDFYHKLQKRRVGEYSVQIKNNKRENICGDVRCWGANCPTMLWLVSPLLQYHPDYVFVGKSIATKYLCKMFKITAMSSDTAFKTENTLHLQDFDVILAFIVPFDTLDRQIRALDSISRPDPFPGRMPLIQKRIAYVIGYDPVLLEGIFDDSATLSLTHYDALWFRSSYEVSLLSQLGIVLPSEGRRQHIFGLGEEDPALSADVHRVVVVCMIEHISACSIARRERMLQKVRDTYFTNQDIDVDGSGRVKEVQIILVLIGGSWDDWLQGTGTRNEVPVVHHTNLSRTVHVRAGETSKAVEFVQSADVVLIMSTEPTSTQSNLFTSCQKWHNFRDTLKCHKEGKAGTVVDVLWPVVAAAVAGRRIHLQYIPPHISHLVREGYCASWSSSQFQVMLQTGANRAFGLGTILSAFSAHIVRPSKDDNKIFLKSFHDSHSSRQKGPLPTVLVELHYENFEVGRDGEACVEQAGLNISAEDSSVDSDGKRSRKVGTKWNTPGERVCLMRMYRYLAIQIHQSNEKGCKNKDEALKFFLRGSFFGDPFYSFNISPREIVQHDRIMDIAPSQWNSTWLASNHAFVYNALIYPE